MSDGDLGTVLLEPLTSEQQVVVDLVCETFFSHGATWPKFQFVEWELDRKGLDLRNVVATFPVVGASPGREYGALGGVRGLQSANEGSDVAVTVNGLWHCKSEARDTAQSVALEIVGVLEAFDVIRSNRSPPPTHVEDMHVTSDEILKARAISRGGVNRWMQSNNFARILIQVMDLEPPFSGGSNISNPDRTIWTRTLNRSVRDYRGVSTVEEYVSRIATLLDAPKEAPIRILTSPLDLPASLGYLDAAWRLLHDRAHLLILHSPEKVASLAFDVASREEFFDRVSALCDVFKSLRVPKGGEQKRGHPLTKLVPYLKSKLPTDSDERVGEALGVLEHIVNIRNGGEHGDAQDRAASSYIALGIRLPVTDWPAAWATVRSRAIAAMDTLRDELLAAGEELSFEES